MEYILKLEQRKRYYTLFISILFVALFIMFSSSVLGFQGFILSIMVVVSVLITPLLINKNNNKLFLILWLCIIPLFDSFKPLLIGSTSIVTYIATGLSIPLATMLIYKKFHIVVKEIPIIKYMTLFLFFLIISFFRSRFSMGAMGDILSSFIQLYILFCLFFYLKDNKDENAYKNVFNWFNIFIIINCTIAILQKITGIGLGVIEGVGRIQGCLGHPNAFAFLLNIYLPLGFYKVLIEKSEEKNLLWKTGLIISFLALVLTFSKTSYILFCVMIFVMFFYLPYTIKNKILLYSVFLTVFLIICDLALGLNIISSIADRFNNNSSLEWRYKVWGYLMYDIKFNLALLIGHGLESSLSYLSKVEPGLRVMPHNVYIQMIYECGLFSIFYFLTFVISGLTFAKALISKNIKDKTFYLVPFVIIIEIFIDMYASNSVLLRSPKYWAWVIIVISFIKLSNDRKQLKKTSNLLK